MKSEGYLVDLIDEISVLRGYLDGFLDGLKVAMGTKTLRDAFQENIPFEATRSEPKV